MNFIKKPVQKFKPGFCYGCTDCGNKCGGNCENRCKND